MNTRRVRREIGWRSLACTVCGPDTTHALMRAGWPKYRWFGPPATEIREYARCLRCGTERSPDEPVTRAASVGDAVIGADAITRAQAGQVADHSIDV
jgi:hypothetical protein